MKRLVVLVGLTVLGCSAGYGYQYSDYTWFTYGGHEYALTREYGTWAQAEEWAKQVGGHLVTVNNAQENAWLYDRFRNNYRQGWEGRYYEAMVWIGLHKVNNQWVWISGEPLGFSSPWHAGAPVPANQNGMPYAYLHVPPHEHPGTWYNHYYTTTSEKMFGIIERAPSTRWSFVQMSDVHIGKGETERTNFAAAVKKLKKEDIDFVVVTGDIVDGACSLHCSTQYIPLTGSVVNCTRVCPPCDASTSPEYENFVADVSVLAKKGIATYTIPGNHDRSAGYPHRTESPYGLSCYESSSSPPAVKAMLGRQWFDHNGWLFVVLDTGSSNCRGSLTQDDMNWLIGKVDASKPKIILTHHPAVAKKGDASGWGKACAYGQMLTDDDVTRQFLDYCENPNKNVYLVLSGHTHLDRIYDRNLGTPESNHYPKYKYIQTPNPGSNGAYRKITVNSLPVADEVVQFTEADFIHISASLYSPGALHVFDSDGNHSGYDAVGGAELGIPESFYFSHSIVEDENGVTVLPEQVLVFDPCDEYLSQVIGTENAAYRLVLSSRTDGNEVSFDANGIATAPGAIHDYLTDWDALSRGEQGATLLIDGDGDGTYDLEIASDANLTREEYMEAHPVITEHVDIAVAMPGYDRRSKELSVEVTITNTSAQTFSAPLWLVIDSVSDPSIVPMDTNTPVVGGLPHVDFSDALSDGTLRPGQSVRKRVAFSNPQGLRFTFEPGVRGLILSSPQQPAAATLQGVLRQWLGADSSLDVAPAGGDGIVNFLDFAALAGRWIDD